MFKVDETKCTGCGICLNVCPVRAISMSDGKAQIEKEKCEKCGV
ncbi:MAG: 4Fe-4S binding protein [candidate division WOR-3 bacterium]